MDTVIIFLGFGKMSNLSYKLRQNVHFSFKSERFLDVDWSWLYAFTTHHLVVWTYFLCFFSDMHSMVDMEEYQTILQLHWLSFKHAHPEIHSYCCLVHVFLRTRTLVCCWHSRYLLRAIIVNYCIKQSLLVIDRRPEIYGRKKFRKYPDTKHTLSWITKIPAIGWQTNLQKLNIEIGY